MDRQNAFPAYYYPLPDPAYGAYAGFPMNHQTFPMTQPEGFIRQPDRPDQMQRQCDSPMSESSSNSSTSTVVTTSNETGSKEKRKYGTWSQVQQKLLVQLWAEHHESLESKDARKTWIKICEELNKRENINKTVEKCKKKMNYLIDRYKAAKEWNRKQSGGSIRKSIFYDEIDAVLGCRDVMTMSKVAVAGTRANSSTSSSLNTSSSSVTDDDTDLAVPGEKEQNVDEKKANRKERKKAKKRKRAYESDDEEEQNEFKESLKSFKQSGEKLGNFMDNFAVFRSHDTVYVKR